MNELGATVVLVICVVGAFLGFWMFYKVINAMVQDPNMYVRKKKR